MKHISEKFPLYDCTMEGNFMDSAFEMIIITQLC